jgi:hypothetical protein
VHEGGEREGVQGGLVVEESLAVVGPACQEEALGTQEAAGGDLLQALELQFRCARVLAELVQVWSSRGCRCRSGLAPLSSPQAAVAAGQQVQGAGACCKQGCEER